MPRKNHSLPRTLTSINQNNNINLQKSIRSRKFMSSSSQLSYIDDKAIKTSSPPTAFSLSKFEDGSGNNLEVVFKNGVDLLRRR